MAARLSSRDPFFVMPFFFFLSPQRAFGGRPQAWPGLGAAGAERLEASRDPTNRPAPEEHDGMSEDYALV